MRRRAAGFILSILVTTALPASGQSPPTATGFAINRFHPSERGSDWFLLDSLELVGHLRPAAGLVLDWSHRPLVIYNDDGSERAALVRNQVFVHVGGSLMLLDRYRLALNLPIAVYQNGTSGSADGASFLGASKPRFGDLRLSGDARILGRPRDPFRLAAGFALFLPTGSERGYTSDGNVRIWPRVLAAGDAGLFSYSGQLGVHVRPGNSLFSGSRVGTELTWAAAAGVRVLERRLLIGPEVSGSSVVTRSFFGRRETPVEALLGAHYTIANAWKVGAGFGLGLTRGFGSPELRGVASFQWVRSEEAPPAVGDRDGDGVLDDVDACPDVRGVPSEDPKLAGCPPPAKPKDRDGDGVLDDADACPNTAGVASDDASRNGCPPDRDGDGVADAEDACPDVVGVQDPDPKKNGCPRDRDQDGVADGEDACPDVAGVATPNEPKTHGCPPDRDADGVVDREDACPTQPGFPDADPKKNGCLRAQVREEQIRIAQQVKFKLNSAEISAAESSETLAAVAEILKQNPQIQRVRVEGHTDSTGSARVNKALSQKRAASVVQWLVKKHKIAASRLSSVGLGPERPIDTNETEEGRQNNRRVEFHIEGARP